MSLPLVIVFLSGIWIIGVTSHSVEDMTHDVIRALAQVPYEEWSPVFIGTNDRIRGGVIRSTLFIPESSTDSNGGEERQKVAAYHIVLERLEFEDLLSKASQSRLPNHSILVTNNSHSGFTVDGVLVTEPDVFVDNDIAIHRIASPLDFKKYGRSEA